MSFRSFICCAVLSCLTTLPSHAVEISQLQARAGQVVSQDQITAVLKELNEYLSQSPEDYAALFLKARLLEQTDQAAAAEGIYQQLIVLNPVRPEAYNNLARLRVAAGDLAGAQALLEKAIHSHPGYATVYDNLSQIYVAMARDSYGKALRLETGEKNITLTELTELTGEETSSATQLSLNQPTAKKSAPKQSVQSSANIESDSKLASETGQQDVQLNLSGKTETVVSDKPSSTFNDNEIITTLEGWAAAWSEQAADVYFVFYAEDYHPPGKSRGSWERERRIRLKKPSWIQIGLKDIEVKPINKGEARVELIQVYRASNYQDMTKKELKLRQTPDGWRIVAERSVSKLN